MRGSEIQQSISELMMQAVGTTRCRTCARRSNAEWHGEPVGPEYAGPAPLAGYYFNFRKTSIYSGSNEIQKNIIAQMILGL